MKVGQWIHNILKKKNIQEEKFDFHSNICLFYRFRHRGPIERCENKAGTTRSTINIKRIKKYHGHHERQIIIAFFHQIRF